MKIFRDLGRVVVDILIIFPLYSIQNLYIAKRSKF